jgi:dihydroorotate dehydrogenase electron transfer subunit
VAVAESWRELVLSWEAEAPQSGQFLTLRVSPYSDPLLRRPFAFSGFVRGASQVAGPSAGARASIIYQIRGNATSLLSELASGSRIDAIGPLGRGFPMPAEGERPILAGGGIGLGPLLFLDKALRDSGLSPVLVLGVRSASLLPSIALPEGAILCTDDGSSGFKGTPVDWIARSESAARNAHASHNAPLTEPHIYGCGLRPEIHIYGCGPAPMLAALASLALERGWKASLSAEQWMACGVGACMGCALPRPKGEGYLRACADGPVFDAADIDWKAIR